ncbi:hypothetical protein MO973_43235 [Paenibacillus sp. TRM 82003]|nr:hypothetical protein [Paenibacillus sp. TRM 82003]
MVHHLKGQHVCILLKDGTYYVGKLVDIKNGELILSGQTSDKAQVSGLLGTLFGGAAGAGAGAAGCGAPFGSGWGCFSSSGR